MIENLREIGGRWVRLARRLGHTLVAFSFFILAGVGVFVLLEEWVSHRQAPANDWLRLSVFGGFTLFLVILGLLSLLKARSVR